MSDYIPPLNRQGLHLYGIEEVEWNVCEDNPENRTKLNFAKIKYKILDEGLLEVDFMSDEEVSDRNKRLYNERKMLLRKPNDAWGEYIDFEDMPLEYLEIAPAWVQRKLNDWEEYQAKLKRGERVRKEVVPPVRCSRRRADGSRCWNWSWPTPSRRDLCRGHANREDFDVTAQTDRIKRIAKMRFNQMTPAALDALEDLIVNSPVPQVRHSAIKTLLELNGFKPGLEVNVSGTVEHEVRDPALAVRQRLASIAARKQEADEDIISVEAEVVREEPNQNVIE